MPQLDFDFSSSFVLFYDLPEHIRERFKLTDFASFTESDIFDLSEMSTFYFFDYIYFSSFFIDSVNSLFIDKVDSVFIDSIEDRSHFLDSIFFVYFDILFKIFLDITTYIESEVPGNTFDEKFLRSTRPSFWRKKIRRAVRLSIATQQLEKGKIGKNGKASSTLMLKNREQQLLNNDKYLNSSYILDKKSGEIINLGIAAKSSNANSKNRIIEIKTRLRGMFELAEEQGLSLLMLTVTCPSRYHPTSTKYDGSTPKHGQDYLQSKWERVRANLKKQKIVAYGARFVEAHKDGCPHWHIAVATDRPNDFMDYAKKAWLDELDAEGTEAGAEKHRLKRDDIRGGSSAMIAYVLPYIMKTKGFNSDEISDIPDLVKCSSLLDDETGRSLIDAASIADAWRSHWSIPAYKSFSINQDLPTAEAWRSMRKVKLSSITDGALADSWISARENDFCSFIKEHQNFNFSVIKKTTFVSPELTKTRILSVERAGSIGFLPATDWIKIIQKKC